MKVVTIKTIQEISEKHNGECLSTYYKNARTRLDFVCKEGHKWTTNYAVISKGHWCPVCSIKIVADKRRIKIEDMRTMARKRFGFCLSDCCVSANTKLLWRCSSGHKWRATPQSIKEGRWCPNCAGSIGERITRHVFESIFGAPFPNSRPKWLINDDTGWTMQLDGYNDELGIAFEYQGFQHYYDVPHLNTTFLQIQKRDSKKLDVCINNNIKLILVPYTIKFDDLPKEIFKMCKDAGLPVKNIKLSTFDINHAKYCTNIHGREEMTEETYSVVMLMNETQESLGAL
ncbi:MAG: hypothetical protein PHT77_13150 [Bacteroidales bacterium]|nr:hypothetical protein [Bacteroidales bacterium]